MEIKQMLLKNDCYTIMFIYSDDQYISRAFVIKLLSEK